MTGVLPRRSASGSTGGDGAQEGPPRIHARHIDRHQSSRYLSVTRACVVQDRRSSHTKKFALCVREKTLDLPVVRAFSHYCYCCTQAIAPIAAPDTKINCIIVTGAHLGERSRKHNIRDLSRRRFSSHADRSPLSRTFPHHTHTHTPPAPTSYNGSDSLTTSPIAPPTTHTPYVQHAIHAP